MLLEKIKNVRFNKKNLKLERYYSTKYDDLFEYKIRQRGLDYHNDNKVKDVIKTKKILSGVVNNYNVSIKFSKFRKIDVKCECPYHNETNIYCKHIYALLIEEKMMLERKKIINMINDNISKYEEVRKKINTLINENKKYLVFDSQNTLNYFDNECSRLKRDYSNIKDHAIILSLSTSFLCLNNIINTYNNLVDVILYSRQEEFERDIHDKIEAEKLEKQKKIEMLNREFHNNETKNDGGLGIFFVLGLLSSLPNKKKNDFDNGLFPWEKEELLNGYDEDSFEEEELEDDDYYSEDDLD